MDKETMRELQTAADGVGLEMEFLELKQDAERYRGLRSLAREGLLNIKGAQSEVLPDMRTHWLLPTIMCSGPVGGFASFDAAVDTVLHNVGGNRLAPMSARTPS